MSKYDAVIGKTIVGCDDGDLTDVLVLTLDNGDRIAIGHGDYGDHIDIRVLSRAEWNEREAERERERLEDEARRQRERERLRLRREEWERMRGEMLELCTPRAFKLWLEQNPCPGSAAATNKALRDAWMPDALPQLTVPSPLIEALARKANGGDTVTVGLKKVDNDVQ